MSYVVGVAGGLLRQWKRWTCYHSLNAEDSMGSIKLVRVRHTNYDKVFFPASTQFLKRTEFFISSCFFLTLFYLRSVSLCWYSLIFFGLTNKREAKDIRMLRRIFRPLCFATVGCVAMDYCTYFAVVWNLNSLKISHTYLWTALHSVIRGTYNNRLCFQLTSTEPCLGMFQFETVLMNEPHETDSVLRSS
jgi:hypothetical protein